MNLLSYVLYIIMIYMIIKTVMLQKKTKKSRKLISIISESGNPDVFFEKIDEYLQEETDLQYTAKARVLKLWGCVLHDRMEMFRDVLKDINIDDLITTNKNQVKSIETNEDSFFYLYLAVPNMLQYKDLNEYRKDVREKLAPYEEDLKDELVNKLSKECDKFYDHIDDRGKAFYEKVMEGDYGEFRYSKSLISLYKNIISANLYKLYEEEGNAEQMDEIKPTLDVFKTSGMGARWLQTIGVELEEEQEENSLDDYKALPEAPERPKEESEKVSLEDFKPAPPIKKDEEE